MKTASSRIHTPRNTLPHELQAPSGGILFESPYPPGEDRGKARPKEAGHKYSSAAQCGLAAQPESIPATTKLPSWHGDTANPSSRPPSLSSDSETSTKTPGSSSIVFYHRRLTTDTVPCSHLSPLAQPAIKMSPLQILGSRLARHEPSCAQSRYGQELESGQPPPRLRGPLPPTRRSLCASFLGPSRYTLPVKHGQPPSGIRDQNFEEQEDANASFCFCC